MDQPDIDSLLVALRREATPLPERLWRVIDQVNWTFNAGRAYWRDRWQQLGFAERIDEGQLKGRWLVLDLDDTILMGSFTTKDEWGALGQSIPGLDRSGMKTDWWSSFKRLLKGKPERVVCRKKHPYLNHPPVEVAFRPAILEGLMELKASGLGLVLVTASARERVEYLKARFPDFAKLFQEPRGHTVTAEDLVHCQLSMREKIDVTCGQASAATYRLRSRSLAMKTPFVVSRCCGIPAYDLLIDDSETTAKIFKEAGLGKKLLFIEGRYPWSGYGVAILDMAVRRLLGEQPLEGDLFLLPCQKEWQVVPPGIPVPPIIEDPLYYPLLHYSDQF